MFAPRPARLFICLTALAVAGCANTGVQGTQASAGGPLWRPHRVLVDDLVLAPDVEVVDRDFAARLESKFGTMTGDVVKAITARRVNDEIVAGIIVMVGAAGLNTRPGSGGEPTPKNTEAVVITGRLHGVDESDRHQRNLVGFGGGGEVAADITLTGVSAGAKKQLLTFTAQAQSGRQSGAAMTELGGPALNAAIATMLGAKSAPDVKLSPGVEAQARGLARAIADKIIAYARQQGWVTAADLAVPAEEAQLAQRKAETPPIAAARHGRPPTSTKTIPCKAFTKNERGNWYVKGPVTFDIGTAQDQTLQDVEIPPKFFTIGGVDLYAEIEKKCHGWQPVVRPPK